MFASEKLKEQLNVLRITSYSVSEGGGIVQANNICLSKGQHHLFEQLIPARQDMSGMIVLFFKFADLILDLFN